MTLRQVRRTVALVTLGWGLAVSALAGTCTITTVPNTNFGAYDTFSTTALDLTSTFRVACTPAPTNGVALCLSASAWTGATSTRSAKRSAGSELISYNLYKNSARTQIWGATTSGANTCYTYNSSATSDTITMYGRVPATQNVPTGAYGDTLTLSITP